MPGQVCGGSVAGERALEAAEGVSPGGEPLNGLGKAPPSFPQRSGGRAEQSQGGRVGSHQPASWLSGDSHRHLRLSNVGLPVPSRLLMVNRGSLGPRATGGRGDKSPASHPGQPHGVWHTVTGHVNRRGKLVATELALGSILYLAAWNPVLMGRGRTSYRWPE